MYDKILFVKKRDSSLEDFDISKIQNSVQTALLKINEFDETETVIEMVSKKVSFQAVTVIGMNPEMLNKGVVDIETIYDVIQDILFDIGYHNSAKRYIKNRYENIISEKDKEIALLRSKLKSYTTYNTYSGKEEHNESN